MKLPTAAHNSTAAHRAVRFTTRTATGVVESAEVDLTLAMFILVDLLLCT